MNEEVIKNTTGLVYLGEPGFYRTHLDLTQPQSLAMADTVRICELFETAVGLIKSAQTNTVLNTFFLAMARNTHVVKQAQKQLDQVTGGERLPEHSDMPELPYISAIIKEILRWSPPVPIGTTHRLMEDDVYNGMFIPAGTTLLENIWCVHLF